MKYLPKYVKKNNLYDELKSGPEYAYTQLRILAEAGSWNY